jgi:hypothetical protein
MSQAKDRSLILVPTHANCHEYVKEGAALGKEISPFPPLDATTCLRCEEAEDIVHRGLPFRGVICPDCPHRKDCLFNQDYAKALAAYNAVATQARGVVSMKEIGKGRRLIIINETPLDMIRPTFVTEKSLIAVELVARQAEHVANNPKDRGWFRSLAQLARSMQTFFSDATTNASYPLPEPLAYVPPLVYKRLNDAINQALTAGPPSEAMRLVLAAALGELSLVAVVFDEYPTKDGEVKRVRKLVGISQTQLPPDSIVRINDATASKEELETVFGQPIKDITPRGRLLLRHPCLQIIPEKDITMARQPAQVLPILRGLLYDLPQKKVGLLTHRKLAKALPDLLESPFKERIVMSEYFGSGLSRGSNRWHRECEVLIVLGTPRVGASAVRIHLLRLHNLRAARLTREKAGWQWDWWSGVKEDGMRVTVRTPHYTDHDWHRAYCSLVRSELVQAVGRGRGILEEGIPVYLVSTENTAPPENDDGIHGLRIANHPFHPLTDAQMAVLKTLRTERGMKCRRTTSQVAKLAGISSQRALTLLKELAAADRVWRVGKASGWVLGRKPKDETVS